jgi:acyl-CoA thioesterase
MNDFIARVMKDPYAKHLGIRFDLVEQGFAVCSLTVCEYMFNFLGVVHGALIFSLADAAFSAASNSDHYPSYALDISGTFMKTAKTGDVIRAEAQLVQATHKTALYRMSVFNGNDLIATFNGTVYKAKDKSTEKKPVL